MRGVKIVVLGVAVAAAVGAVALVREELERARTSSVAPQIIAPAEPEELPKVDVLIATAALKRGAVLRPRDLEWRPWPEDFVSESFITRDAAPDALETTIGALARVDFAEGEPILPERVVKPGDSGFMAAMLRPNMRAFAIAVRFETGVGGFVLPGDLVDIILTRRESLEIRKPDGELVEKDAILTDTLIENARVLAVDTLFDPEDNPTTAMERTATVEVTPDQTELLSLAEEAGRLTLALRPTSDLIGAEGERLDDPLPTLAIESGAFDPINLVRVVGGEEPAAEPQASGREITIFRWNRLQTQELP